MLLAGAFLLGTFFVYVYQQKRQAYLLLWASAWFLLSFYFVRSAFAGPVALSGWFAVINDWVLALAALAFYCSSRLYARFTLSARRAVIVAGGVIQSSNLLWRSGLRSRALHEYLRNRADPPR